MALQCRTRLPTRVFATPRSTYSSLSDPKNLRLADNFHPESSRYLMYAFVDAVVRKDARTVLSRDWPSGDNKFRRPRLELGRKRRRTLKMPSLTKPTILGICSLTDGQRSISLSADLLGAAVSSGSRWQISLSPNGEKS